ncbi:MAG TPA: aquaporin [Candidatus Dormibacteraeota bacterium]
MTRLPKLITETIGTFTLLTVIALSGPIGPLAPLAIGAALMAMVYMGGHISGAQYNPAVSFGMFLRKKLPATEMAGYWVAQLLGAVLAFGVGYLVSGHTPGIHPGAKVQVFQALAVEILFTAVLVLVIINVAASKATQGNSFYGLAIGSTIAAATFVGGPISGGAFNPAVGFGATLGSAMFGAGGWSDLWIYVVGPLIGGAIGAGIGHLQGNES